MATQKLVAAITSLLASGQFEDKAVIVDGRKIGHGNAQSTKPEPFVIPAIVDSNDQFVLFENGSIGVQAVDAYTKDYKGPGQVIYGVYFSNNDEVFPQIKDNPLMAAACAINNANTHSARGANTAVFGGCMQGETAEFAAPGTGHIYKPGSVHALRGTIAMRAKASEAEAVVETWKAANFMPVQVEQGADTPTSGIHFGGQGDGGVV
jgi:hypothetical protein